MSHTVHKRTIIRSRQMQLYYSPTSPFARKVRVLINELKIQDQFDLLAVDPWTDPNLRPINPLSKIPTLVVNHKEVLFDLALICEYLSTLKDKKLGLSHRACGIF